MHNYRFDRALSVGMARPLLPLLDRVTHAQRIPILMYHGVRECNGTTHPYFEPHTSPRAFISQMQYLRDQGYHAVSLRQVLDAMDGGDDLTKLVGITFDDGYRDFYDIAFPILKRHGFSATVFLITGRMLSPRSIRDYDVYMGWEGAREVQEHGFELGSHTVTHPNLHWLSPQLIDDELELSKRMIEERLGCVVQSFSCPNAFPEHRRGFVRMLRERLQKHGYRGAVTTVIGTAHLGSDHLLLPRLPVNVHDDLELFAAKLEGAYNWLHVVQTTWKFLQFRQAAS
jgi:peptidoglycan/xylan/chitin deacetylase (PgdA/CDA1 family)